MTPKVLILTSEPTDSPGGVEHVLGELERGLTRLGYNVALLNRLNAAPRWVARPASKWIAYAADLLLSWYLGRHVGRLLGSDLTAIVSNGPYGWYLPRLPKSVKKVHFYHGTYRGQTERIRPLLSFSGALKLKWWDSMVLERLSGRGKFIVCNSEQTRQEVQEYFGYSGETVWLPLDTSHFTPLDKLESRRKLELPKTGKIGLFVGSVQPAKGFSTVLKLIEAFPDVYWCLALRGTVPENLTRNERLAIFHNAGRELLPSIYNAADFAVCPSLYEAFGYVVAEGLACGIPVVSSLGGVSSALLWQTPLEHLLIADAHSFKDFQTAIRLVLGDPDHHRQLVVRLIRPEIEKRLGLENWLRHFCGLTGI